MFQDSLGTVQLVQLGRPGLAQPRTRSKATDSRRSRPWHWLTILAGVEGGGCPRGLDLTKECKDPRKTSRAPQKTIGRLKNELDPSCTVLNLTEYEKWDSFPTVDSV